MTTTPLVQLTFYPDVILCTHFDALGQSTYPVSPQDVAEAVADVLFTTGWLPPRTLLVERHRGMTTIAIHIPAGRHTVQVETASGVHLWRIPFPDLVFVGRGTTYLVFATKTPPAPHMPLFHAPCSNVSPQGVICAGNTPFPSATAETIQRAFEMFMGESLFNSHLSLDRITGRYHSNVLTLWQHLATRPRASFPVRSLRPLHTTLPHLLRVSGLR